MSFQAGLIYIVHLVIMTTWALALNIYREMEYRRLGFNRWRNRALFPLWIISAVTLPIILSTRDLMSGIWLGLLGLIFTFAVRDMVQSYYKNRRSHGKAHKA